MTPDPLSGVSGVNLATDLQIDTDFFFDGITGLLIYHEGLEGIEG